jgi:hypothetical protein
MSGTFRPCTKCREDKAVSRSWCHKCMAAASKVWRQRNRDKVLAQKRRAYQRDPAKKIASVAEWRRRNPAKYKLQNQHSFERNKEVHLARLRVWKLDKAKVAESGKRYRIKYPAKVSANTRFYQTRKKRATPVWVNRSTLEVFYAEAQELSRQTGILHEVDHIIPLTHPLVCGLHVPANLQVLPRGVNRRKANQWIPE